MCERCIDIDNAQKDFCKCTCAKTYKSSKPGQAAPFLPILAKKFTLLLYWAPYDLKVRKQNQKALAALKAGDSQKALKLTVPMSATDMIALNNLQRTKTNIFDMRDAGLFSVFNCKKCKHFMILLDSNPNIMIGVAPHSAGYHVYTYLR